MNGMMKHFLWFAAVAIAVALCGVDARAQKSRKDDIVFNAHGTAAKEPTFLAGSGFCRYKASPVLRAGSPFFHPEPDRITTLARPARNQE